MNWAIRLCTENEEPNIILVYYGAQFSDRAHLFTGICHVHYPKIAPIVKSAALAFGLPYHEQETF